MKNLLLTGYYGFSNIGDEAVLECIVKELKAAIPGVRITVLSNNPEETAAFYGVTAVNRWQYFRVLRAMYRSDMFILGGGSLLQDITGSKSLFFYLSHIIAARLCACPVFLYAQGIGPINKKRNLCLTKFVLKLARAITVRDEDSYSLLKNLGIKESKLFLTCDPVLAMVEKDMPPPLPQGKKVAFAMRSWQGFSAAAFASFADYVIDSGYQVVFLPFNEPEDREIAEQVAALMKHKSFLPAEALSSGAMFAAISCMDLMVGMRLHAGIMAAAAAVPFLPVVYDPKVSSFARQTGQEITIDIEEIGTGALSQVFEEMLPRLDEIHHNLLTKKDSWHNIIKANAVIAREAAFGTKRINIEDILTAIAEENRSM